MHILLHSITTVCVTMESGSVSKFPKFVQVQVKFTLTTEFIKPGATALLKIPRAMVRRRRKKRKKLLHYYFFS